MEWNEEAISELRRLWAEGMPTKEIGAVMGINKNQVIGKVHRLRLPGRNNPIRSAAPAIRPKPALKPKAEPAAKPTPKPTSTLPELPSLMPVDDLNSRIVTMRANGVAPVRIAQMVGLPVTSVYKRAARNRGNVIFPAVPGTPRRWTPGERLAPVTPVAPSQPDPSADRLAGVVFKPRPPGACCWPLWGMQRPTHSYCDAPADAGRSYCQDHMRIAYVPAKV